ncbi:MAG: hypothetical protein O2967_19190 [Proteobacteria bacterium]|nr:hypothetical protein [Pseudomonadota bacterium]
MTEDRRSDFSFAFDALLDQNRQRLDALYGGSANAGARASRTATVAALGPASEGRRSARINGLDFSFDM